MLGSVGHAHGAVPPGMLLVKVLVLLRILLLLLLRVVSVLLGLLAGGVAALLGVTRVIVAKILWLLLNFYLKKQESEVSN